MAGKIFINYRRDDDPGNTGRLFDLLQEAFEQEQLFMDVESIAPGLDFVEVLQEKVAQCDAMLVIIGPRWLEAEGHRLADPSDFVRIEIELALNQDKRVIPVLVGEARMPRADELPEAIRPLARRNAVRLTHERFRADTQALIKALEDALNEAEALRQAQTEALRQSQAKRGISEQQHDPNTQSKTQRSEVEPPVPGAKWPDATPKSSTDIPASRSAPGSQSTRTMVIAACMALAIAGAATWLISGSSSPVRAPITAQPGPITAQPGPITAQPGPITAQPGEMTVDGPDPLAFAGSYGGPFSPSRIVLRIKTKGPGFDWSVAAVDAPWLDIAPNQGSLAADGSSEIVLATAPSAQRLSRGSHRTELRFSNGSQTITRDVHLNIRFELQSGLTCSTVVPAPEFLRGRMPRPLSMAEECALKPQDPFKECDVCPDMVVVPSGTFTMGSPAGDTGSPAETGRGSDEGPQHKVTFKGLFAVGRFAVTFDEWDACVTEGGCSGYRPSDESWGRGRRPVIYVNWNDAKAYVTWLSRKTGNIYRLLSEAEREYVTRAETRADKPPPPFWFGSSVSLDQANFGGADIYSRSTSGFRGKTVPVDSFAPNPWGLYQVHGNVREWTEDCYNDSYRGAPDDGSAWLRGNCARRVLRNGSWINMATLLRSAFRGNVLNFDARSSTTGFRVARTFLLR